MNKVSKLILLSTVLALTACGGSNSTFVSTLPDANTKTDTNIDTQKNPEQEQKQEVKPAELTLRKSVDNKAEIVSFIKNKGIDVSASEYDRLKDEIEAFENSQSNSQEQNRSASSRRRNATSNNAKSDLSNEEKEYKVANYKYHRVTDLASKGFNKVKEAVQEAAKEIVEDLLKLFGFWQEGTTVEVIINNTNEDAFNETIEKEKEEIKKNMTLSTLKLEDVTFYNQSSDESLKYEFDKDKNEYVLTYTDKQDNNTDGSFVSPLAFKVSFPLSSFTQDKNGISSSTVRGEEKKSKLGYFLKTDNCAGTCAERNGVYYEVDEEAVGETEEEIKKIVRNSDSYSGYSDEWTDEDFEKYGAFFEDVDWITDYTLKVAGTTVGLSYSEFGFLFSQEKHYLGDEKYDCIEGAFYGGYKNKLVAESNHNNMDYTKLDNAEFTGKALGGVHIENNAALILSGDAKLTVDKDNQEQKLVLTFDNFYDVTAIAKNNTPIDVSYSNYTGDKDSIYKNFFEDVSPENNDWGMKTQYYGDGGKASEVVGTLHYSNHRKDDEHIEHELELSFGAKKN